MTRGAPRLPKLTIPIVEAVTDKNNCAMRQPHGADIRAGPVHHRGTSRLRRCAAAEGPRLTGLQIGCSTNAYLRSGKKFDRLSTTHRINTRQGVTDRLPETLIG